MKVNKKQLRENWKDLLEAENMPEIATQSKKDLVARIFENQYQDTQSDSVYKDSQLVETFGDSFRADEEINEAVVGGDHGYNADNIAKGQTTGAVTNIGPAVMGMVRRAIPNMIAFDVAGVQPLDLPTGSVFTMRSMYGKNPLDAEAREAFHPMHSPDSMYSGAGASDTFAEYSESGSYAVGDIVFIDWDAVPRQFGVAESKPQSGKQYFQFVQAVDGTTTAVPVEDLFAAGNEKVVNISEGMATSVAELQEGFNGSTNNPWNEMSFRIDKQTVEAKSRQLKAQYSIELAQDLKAVHGMDADVQLSNILSTEVLLEINRELVVTINAQAQPGKTGWTNVTGGTAGVFDLQDSVDVKGARWAGESYKMLLSQIDKEANEIGRQTGRGVGNFIIASRNVVSAFAQTDALVGGSAYGMQQGMNTDTNKAVFAGILGGRYRVYIDQYAHHDYFTVGFKGGDEMDAGVYYSPYVPLTPLRGSDSKNMQPVLGFKTRYAFSVNPLADPAKGMSKISSGSVLNGIGKNSYFRRVLVKGL